MAESWSAPLTGLKDVVSRLQSIPPEMRKNGGPIRAGLAAGGRLIRDEARETAPKDKGLLAESIILIRDKNPRRTPGASERYVIGVKGGGRGIYGDTTKNRRKRRVGKKYEKGGQAYYFRFVELGTEKMPGTGFMRKAMARKAEEAINLVATRIDKSLDRLVKKANRIG